MIAADLAALLMLTAVSVALCLMLALAVVLRKASRDRRERAMLERRGAAKAAMLAGERAALIPLFVAARRQANAQVDLAAALEQVLPECGRERMKTLYRCARRAGLSEALAQQTRARDPLQRGRAVLLIGLLRLPDTAELAGPLLSDPDPDVQLAAVRALAVRADRETAQLLIAALRDGEIPAARVIERVAAPWAAVALTSALRAARREHADAASDFRTSIARALGLTGSADAERDLVALLREGSREERTSAARALGTLAQDSTAPLLDALQDEEWPVRAQAAKAFGMLRRVEAVDALAMALTDSSWWVRANAGRSLRELGEPGVATLREAARSSTDRFARARAREELGILELTTEAA